MHISAGKKKDSILSQYKNAFYHVMQYSSKSLTNGEIAFSWYNYIRTDYAQQEQGLVLPRIWYPEQLCVAAWIGLMEFLSPVEDGRISRSYCWLPKTVASRNSSFCDGRTINILYISLVIAKKEISNKAELVTNCRGWSRRSETRQRTTSRPVHLSDCFPPSACLVAIDRPHNTPFFIRRGVWVIVKWNSLRDKHVMRVPHASVWRRSVTGFSLNALSVCGAAPHHIAIRF